MIRALVNGAKRARPAAVSISDKIVISSTVFSLKVGNILKFHIQFTSETGSNTSLCSAFSMSSIVTTVKPKRQARSRNTIIDIAMMIDDGLSLIDSSLFGLIQNLLHSCLPTQIIFISQFMIHLRCVINGFNGELFQICDILNHIHP